MCTCTCWQVIYGDMGWKHKHGESTVGGTGIESVPSVGVQVMASGGGRKVSYEGAETMSEAQKPGQETEGH